MINVLYNVIVHQVGHLARADWLVFLCISCATDCNSSLFNHFMSLIIFSVIMIFNSPINVFFNNYSFIVILIWNVGFHSEHTTNVPTLTSHCVSLLSVLY